MGTGRGGATALQRGGRLTRLPGRRLRKPAGRLPRRPGRATRAQTKHRVEPTPTKLRGGSPTWPASSQSSSRMRSWPSSTARSVRPDRFGRSPWTSPTTVQPSVRGLLLLRRGMDRREAPGADGEFEAFVTREQTRGTNFVQVIGGEPSVVPGPSPDPRRLLPNGGGHQRAAPNSFRGAREGAHRRLQSGAITRPIPGSAGGAGATSLPPPCATTKTTHARAGTTRRLPGTRTRSSRWWSNP